MGLSDEELVVRFQQEKDIKILGELYHRYMELTMGLCMKYIKNTEESEDAVMEIFEILVRRLPNHKVDNFRAWLYRLASNHCLDILRKNKRLEEKQRDHVLMHFVKKERHYDEWLSIENDDKEMVLKKLEECLEDLKEEQQRSIQLFYIEKKSYDEISSLLDITWSKTRSLIQNGRRNLKKCMEKKNESARAK